jgi:outer membrane protein OmpA-like peptidoglycan-associated protein
VTHRPAASALFGLCTILFSATAAAQNTESNANATASASIGTQMKADAGGMTVGVKLEPGVAFPLSAPQTDNFGVGGGGFARLGLGVLPFLDLQAGAGFLGFGGKNTRLVKSELVSITMLAAGARLQKPHDGPGVSPWLDAEGGFIQTGDLSRFGYSVGGGLQFGLGDRGQYWIGPFARFLQVTSGDKPEVDAGDARILMLGLTFEIEVMGRGKDSDGDGILDADDKCPTVPGLKQFQGCPDKDGDGIPDIEDKCPDDPGPKETQGCPIGDTDHDGVPDKDDRCPKTPGPKENQGCPDSDGDTVNDADDQCPTVKGEPDNKGCPKYKQVTVKESKIEISQKIFFAFGQATILPKSFDILDEVAQALKDASKLRIRIEGHTDSVGTVEHNLALSEARAAAVREYLIGQGLAPDRLESKGYGPTLPLETNATAEGRERNRRVEFVILNK